MREPTLQDLLDAFDRHRRAIEAWDFRRGPRVTVPCGLLMTAEEGYRMLIIERQIPTTSTVRVADFWWEYGWQDGREGRRLVGQIRNTDIKHIWPPELL